MILKSVIQQFKFFKTNLTSIAFLLLALLLSSCETGVPADPDSILSKIPIQYTVTFDSRGGSPVPPQTVIQNTTAQEPPTPSVAGLSFGGWYTDLTLSSKFYFTNIITNNITLYAKWGNPVVLTFDSKGGAAIPSQTNVQGFIPQPPPALTQPGATFASWHTDPALSSAPFDFTAPVNKDTTVYAKWNVVVDFDSRGAGSAVPSQTVIQGTNAQKPTDPTPNIAGQSFGGWYTDLALSSKFYFTNIITNDVTLYARWGASVVLAFDSKGGAAVPSQTNTLGFIPKQPPTLTQPGTTFASWHTDPALSSAPFDFTAPVNKDTTLYAKWNVVVDFDSRGAGSAVPSQTVIQGTNTQKPTDPTPNIAGQSFGGWYTDLALSSKFYFTNIITNDITLYAKWGASVILTFDSKGGAAVASQTNILGFIPKQPPTLTQPGTTFASWHTDPAFSSAPFDFTAPVNNNTTLYAKWDVVVDFDSRGAGSAVPSQTIIQGTNAQKPTDPTPNIAGQSFGGWYTDLALSSEFYFTNIITNDITIYAKWGASVVLTFDSKGAAAIPSQTNIQGFIPQPPPILTKPGTTFGSWHTDPAFSSAPFDFTAPVNNDTTVYAKWNVTVDFDSRGAGSAVPSQTVIQGTNAQKPTDPTPSIAGQTFGGWYTDLALSSEFYFTNIITNDITIYAKWGASIVLTFDSKGGPAVASQTNVIGFTPKQPPTLTQPGTTFASWHTDPAFSSAPFDFTAPVNSDTTVYAKWDVTVDFDSRGAGSAVPSQTIIQGTNAQKPTDPTPSFAGQSFGGWYTDLGLSSKFYFTNIITNDITVYAKWGASVVLTFDSKGGPAVASQTNTRGFIPQQPPALTKPGTTFASWHTDPAFSSPPFDFTAPVNNDTTLYAKWDVTVIFDSRGAGSAVPSQTIVQGTNAQKPTDPTPSFAGQSFGGWYTDLSLSSEFYFTNIINSNITIYAKWGASVVLTFDSKGGPAVASQTNARGFTPTPPPTLTQPGTTFSSWHTDPALSSAPFDFTASVNSDTTVYAKWNVVVIFDSRGAGSAVSPQTIIQGTNAQKPTDPTPSFAGQSFGGWYTDLALSSKFYFTNVINSDITLYARWGASIVLTFDSKGGAAVPSQTNSRGFIPQQPPILTKPGTTFSSWHTDPALSSAPFDFTAPVNSDTTVYAKWNVTVIFDSRGAGSAVPSQTIVQGTNAQKPTDPTPHLASQSFGGWYSDPAFASKFYFTNIITNDITIYAKWGSSVVLTFDSKGGPAVASQTNVQGFIPTPPPTLTQPGTTFASWHTDPAFSSAPFDFTASVNNDTTVYAKWNVVVIFDSRGAGSAVPSQTIIQGTNAQKPTDPTPSIAGQTFGGWYTDLALSSKFYFTNIINSDITLYARWGASVVLTFDSKGGAAVASQTNVRGFIPKQPPTLTKPGTTFASWHTDPTLSSAPFDFTAPVNNDTTVYAKWNVVVIFDSRGAGSAVTPQTIIQGTNAQKPTDPTPSIAGQSFGGWYSDPAFASKFYFTNIINSDTTLYAKWGASVVLTFDSKGGPAVASQTNVQGFIPKQPPTLTQPGTTFTSWHTDPAFSSAPFDFTAPVNSDTTVYAKWNVVVIFDSRGAGSAVTPQTLIQGTNAQKPTDPTPSFAGQSFGGWYSDPALSSKFYFTNIINSDTTLYAKWGASVVLTFDSKGGPAVASQTNTRGFIPQQPPALTKPGTTFASWHTDPALSSAPFDFTAHVNSDTTVYAKWNVTVTFDSRGAGSAVPSQTIIQGTNAQKPTDPTPHIAGQSFGGWYSDLALSSEFYFTNIINSNIAIYAKWGASVVLTFDSKGGAAVASQTNVQGFIPHPPPTLTQPGATFASWHTDPAFSSAPFDFTAPVNNDTTVYAKWNVVVAFDSRGAGSAVASQTIIQGTNAQKPTDPTPRFAGQTFGGWYTDLALSSKFYFTNIITNDINLYARWGASVVLTFDSKGGTAVASQTNTRGFIPRQPPTLTKPGATFASWHTDPAFSSAPFDFTAPVNSDTTVYAKWNVTVTFDSRGAGSAVPSQTIMQGTNAQKPTDPTPHLASQSFGGWYSDPTLSSKFYFTNIINSDTTIYAKWGSSVVLTFDSKGGPAVASQTNVQGFIPTPPPTLTQPGTTFASWHTDPAFSSAPFDFTAPVNNDTTVYAKWNVVVIFDSRGAGSAVPSQTLIQGTNAQKPTDPTPSIAGQSFGGWYTDLALSSKFYFTNIINSDITLYARWGASVILTFDSKGGPAVASQTNTRGFIPTPPPTLTQPGTTFASWHTDPAFSSAPFDFTAPVNSDTTIYAKWNVVVIFDSRGAGSAVSPQTLIQGTNAQKPTDPTPNLASQSFGGWYSDSALSSKFYFTNIINSDTTLYAKWGSSVVLTFDSKGGPAVASQTNIQGFIPTPPPTLTQPGTTFASWHTDPAFSSAPFDFTAPVNNDTTVYAKWNVVVIFDSRGAGSAVPSQTLIQGTNAQKPTDPTPSIAGQSFGGWYTDLALSSKFYFTNIINSDITLYARWGASVILTFDSKGGPAVASQTNTRGFIPKQPPTLTQPGATFASWHTDPAFSSAPFDFTAPVNSDTTVYAKWNVTVIFDSRGAGSAVPSQTIIQGTNAQKPTDPTPNLASQSFGGWYTDSTFSSKFYFTNIINSDTTIYAKWGSSVVLTFDSKGGPAVASQTNVQGFIPTPPPTLTQPGTTFASWHTDPAFSSAPFDFTAPVNNDTTVYAKWNVVVIFDSRGAGSAVTPQTLIQGTNAQKPTDPTPSIAGQTFGGWYTDQALSSKFYFTNIINSDITLYARWGASVVLTFDSKGGPAVASQTNVQGFIPKQPPTLTQPGATFASWHTDPALSSAPFDFTAPVNNDTTVYAKWNVVVIFDSRGAGSAVTPQTLIQGTNAQKPTDPTPSIAGQSFGGWYTDPALSSKFYFTNIINSDTTIYARWGSSVVLTFDSKGGPAVASQTNIQGFIPTPPPTLTQPGATFASWHTDPAFSSAPFDFTAPVNSDTTVYAKWNVVVIFDSRGAGSAVASQTLIQGTNAQKPTDPTPSFAGQSFGGWYTDLALSSKFYFTNIINSDITLYARWGASVVLTFDSKGGPAVASQTNTRGFIPTPPPTLTQPGTTFASWHTDPAFSSTPFDFTAPVNSDTTVYAKWDVTVTFDSRGAGSAVPSQTIIQGTNAQKPTDPTPHLASQSFGGWYSDSALSSKFYFTNIINSDTTLYAKWGSSVVLTFDSKGGPAVASQTNIQGFIPKQPPTLTQPGATFTSWHTDPAFSSAPFDFTAPVNSDTTLYAKWNVVVIFDSRGAGSAVTPQTLIQGTNAQKPTDPTPSIAGQSFGGWYSDQALSSKFYFTNIINSDITLYAKWGASVVLTFDSKGGPAIPSQTNTRGFIPKQPPTPTQPGATFASWHTDPAFSSAPFDFTAPVNSDTTVYAKWNVTVIFDSRGAGSAVPSQTIIQGTNAQKPTDPTPNLASQSFGGWYSDSALSSKFYFTNIINSDTTLYAKWGSSVVLTFDSKGGPAVASQTNIQGFIPKQPPTLTQPGTTFASWHTDPAFSSTPFDFTAPVNNNTTLYAKWNVVVDFDSRGAGSAVASQTLIQGTNAQKPTDPTPSFAGQTFGGWYTDLALSSKFYFTNVINSDITLYARWGASVVLTFDSKGGAAVASQTNTRGFIPTPPPTLTQPGTTFASWHTDPAFSSAPFDFTAPVNSDTTVYAKWNVTVIFDSRGSGSAVTPQTLIQGTNAQKPTDPTPNLASQSFGGWYSDSALSSKFYFTNIINNDTTLYAKWGSSVVLTFNSKGGPAVASQTNIQGFIPKQPPTLTQPGTTFSSWHTDPAFSSAPFDFTAPVNNNTTLYAKWNVVVIFDSRGSGSAVSPQTIIQGTNAQKPTDPTPNFAGQTFGGWYTDQALSSKFYFTNVINSDITLYARWGSSVVLAFDSKGGPAVASQTNVIGFTPKQPPTLTQSGATFASWHTDPAFSSPPFDFTAPVNSDTTLYAKWNVVVIFDSRGAGSAVTPQTVIQGTNAQKPTDPTPSIAGQSFGGWYTDLTFSSKFYFTNIINSDITLYARWGNSVVLTFDSKGGPAVASQTNIRGFIPKQPPTLTQPGATFTSWHTDPAFSSAPFDFTTPVNSDTTLYAKWNVVVIFDSRGAGSAVASQTLIQGTNAQKPTDPTPSFAGQTFGGWYSDQALSSKFYFTNIINSDITLYARWGSSVVLTFDSKGGAAVASQTNVIGFTPKQPPTLTKPGATFASWHTDPAFSSAPFNFTDPVNSDTTVYAKWNVVVIFDSRGAGSAVPSQTIIQGTNAQKPTDPTPSIAGQSFGGWYSDLALSSKFYFTNIINSDINLYAKWGASVVLTFDSKGGAAVASQTNIQGFIPKQPPTLTQPGATFASWHTDPAFSSAPFDFTAPVNNNTTLYAKWNVVVIFDSRGAGSAVASQTLIQGTNAQKPTDPTPSIPGESFGGWYSDQALSSKFYFTNIINSDTTLYAKWGNSVVLTFDSKGGAAVASQTNIRGFIPKQPPTLTQPGATFASWHTDPTFSSAPFDFTAPVNNNTTLYAKWNVVVIFDSRGSGSAVASQTLIQGTNAQKPTDPTPNIRGQSFGGWYSDLALSSKFYFTNIINSDTTIYAKWGASVVLTFDSKGGPAVASQTNARGFIPTPPPTLTQPGTTFASWHTDPTFSSAPFDFTAPVNNNTTLYAKWNVVVIFDSRGSGSRVSPQTIIQGTNAQKPTDPTPNLASQSFGGWYTDSTFSSKFYFTNIINSDTTLYARWGSSVVLTFDSKGGAAVASQTNIQGFIPKQPPTLTQPGATFASWHTDPALSSTPFDFTTPINNNTTLYAKWNVVVAFDSRGAGSLVTSQTLIQGTNAQKPTDPTPYIRGQSFGGWYSDQALSSKFYFTNIINSDTTLYARWGASVVLAFDSKGGAAVASQTNVRGFTPKQPPTLTQPGATFASWHTDPALSSAPFDFTAPVNNNTTLYAKWNVTVTFDSRGAGSAVTSQTLIQGTNAQKPTDPTPSIAGQSFGGWYTDLALSSKFYFTNIINSDINLYAKWGASVVLTFDSKGGAAVASQTNIQGFIPKQPPTLTQPGATFASWHTDPALSSAPFDFTAPVNNNTTVYAKWNVVVIFDSRGSGSAVTSQTIIQGTNAQKPTDPTPNFAGQSFGGWYSDPAFSSKFYFTNIINSDITLYAKWGASAVLTFDSKGGPAVASQTNIRGFIPKQPPTLTQPGATFASWHTDPAFSSAPFDFTVPVNNDTTLYAKWNVVVIFDSRGSGSAVPSQTLIQGTNAQKPTDPTPNLASQSFGGWYSDSTLSSKFYFTNIINSDTTLYAKWGASVVLTFDSKGGSAVASQTNIQGFIPKQPPTLTQPGATFASWHTDPAFSSAPFDFTAPVNNDTTLYAKWNVVVIFDSRGAGSAVASQTLIQGTNAQKPTDPTPNLANQKFSGWYTDPALSSKFYFTSIINSDTTLYAKWVFTSTVTFDSRGSGSAVPPQTVIRGTNAQKPTDPTPNLANQSFGGWYSDSALSSKFYFTNIINNDIILYARWGTSAVLTFDSRGGSAVASQTNIQGFIPKQPSSFSYSMNIFQGWYTDPAFSSAPFDFTAPVNSDTTLYAKWKLRPANRSELANIVNPAIAANPTTNLNHIDTSLVTDMNRLFLDSDFNGDISLWNVSNVNNMVRIFSGATNFNQDLSRWNTTNVTDMSYMFSGAAVFNQDLSGWQVNNVTKMGSMFGNTRAFNQDLSRWNVSNVTDFSAMFYYSTFTGNVDLWNVSGTADLTAMFWFSKRPTVSWCTKARKCTTR